MLGAIQNYLHDVFIMQFDAWVTMGSPSNSGEYRDSAEVARVVHGPRAIRVESLRSVRPHCHISPKIAAQLRPFGSNFAPLRSPSLLIFASPPFPVRPQRLGGSPPAGAFLCDLR